MTSGNRSFFAPSETRLDLPQGVDQQTLEITRPATPSESDQAPFLSRHDHLSHDPSGQDARLGAKAFKPDNQPPTVSIMALLPVLSYCGASITMTVVNKFTVSGAGFNMNLLILLIQQIVGVICVLSAERFGWIQLRGLNKKDVQAWLPISFMLGIVIYTGSKSIQYLNIPVYTIFKNLTIILIAYGEVFWFGGRVTKLVFFSFALMVFSSVIAAWSDVSNAFLINNLSMPHTPDSISGGGMSFDPKTGMAVQPFDIMKETKDSISAQIGAASSNDVFDGLRGYGVLSSGYVWMFFNCVASAAFVLCMRKRIKITGFKDWDTMYYNNLLSIPFLLIMSFLIEDWSSANFNQNFPSDKRFTLTIAIVFSGVCAVFISYTTAWCIRATSSTTYSMVGALNKLPLALSGMIFFKDPPVTFQSVSAITVGFLAGLAYAFGKNKQAQAAKLAAISPVTGLSRERSSSHSSSNTKTVIPLHNMNASDHKD